MILHYHNRCHWRPSKRFYVGLYRFAISILKQTIYQIHSCTLSAHFLNTTFQPVWKLILYKSTHTQTQLIQYIYFKIEINQVSRNQRFKCFIISFVSLRAVECTYPWFPLRRSVLSSSDSLQCAIAAARCSFPACQTLLSLMLELHGEPVEQLSGELVEVVVWCHRHRWSCRRRQRRVGECLVHVFH